ncbi:hypothetical protein CRG98_026769 [Punica granatum]|uniref:Retrotransposon Copia-like N-terminal domain-containing protein n=1 Tax=Punica granatum TaxID=22663 RepID=A0A2I0J988_PUNGR|nr:hypothetical protein CRG98_026769 [Punica granatum]
MSHNTDTSSHTVDPTTSPLSAPAAVHLLQNNTHALSSPSNPPSATITASNITNLDHVQLNNSNYLVWKTLFSTCLKSHDPDAYSVTSPVSPAPERSDEAEKRDSILTSNALSYWRRTRTPSVRTWLQATSKLLLRYQTS